MLLVQVNAREVTKTLDITGLSLRGTGLLPLAGSRVLEILLSRYTGLELDAGVVVRILRTMLPYRLLHVHIRYISDNSLFLEFSRELRGICLQRAKELPCSACDKAIWEDKRQIVGGPLSPTCQTCRHHFCRTGSCTTAVMECSGCREVSCDGCNQVSLCSVCSLSFCNDCRYIARCVECKKTFCGECRLVNTCSMCGISRCKECYPAPAYCDNCDKKYCSDCRKIYRCSECTDDICEGCNDCKFLDCCNALVCSDCKPSSFCDGCQRTLEARFVEECEICDKSYCRDCAQVDRCGSCYDKFCNDCRQVNFLSCCNESRCSECTPSSKCEDCRKDFRRDLLDKCDACDRSLCESCRTSTKHVGDTRHSFPLCTMKPSKRARTGN